MLYFADFETTTANTDYYKKTKDATVWLWHIKDIDNSSGGFFGVNLRSFINKIKELDDPVIYFHNLTFDGDFILKYLVNELKTNLVNVLMDVNEVNVFRQGGKIYKLEWITPENRLIIFKCSYLILNTSINNLGKSIGLKKLKEDDESFYDVEPYTHLNQVPQKYIDYIINDVEIARVSFLNLRKILMDEFNIDVVEHLTINSACKKIMYNEAQKYIDETKLNIKAGLFFKNKKETYQVAKQLYRGGLTQFNKKFLGETVLEKSCMIDVNSAYPYAMTMDLPYGELMDHEPNTQSAQIYYLEIEGEINPEYSSIVCYPNLTGDGVDEELIHPITEKKVKHRNKFRYLEKITKHKAYFWKKEFEVLNKIYNLKYKILNVYFVKTKPFLKDYINKLYKYKKEFKHTNKGLCQAVKIVLNSSYGSLCLKENYLNFLYYKELPNQDILKNKLYVKQGESPFYNVGSYKCGRYYNDDYNYTNKLAASYITMFERVKLLRCILKNGADNFIYCDTDSIVFNNTNTPRCQIGDELGEWSFELRNNDNWKIFVRGAKKYMIEENGVILKQRFAGIDSEFDWTMVDKSLVYVENANFSMQRVKSGILLIKKDKIIKKGSV